MTDDDADDVFAQPLADRLLRPSLDMQADDVAIGAVFVWHNRTLIALGLVFGMVVGSVLLVRATPAGTAVGATLLRLLTIGSIVWLLYCIAQLGHWTIESRLLVVVGTLFVPWLLVWILLWIARRRLRESGVQFRPLLARLPSSS